MVDTTMRASNFFVWATRSSDLYFFKPCQESNNCAFAWYRFYRKKIKMHPWTSIPVSFHIADGMTPFSGMTNLYSYMDRWGCKSSMIFKLLELHHDLYFERLIISLNFVLSMMLMCNFTRVLNFAILPFCFKLQAFEIEHIDFSPYFIIGNTCPKK